MRVIVAKPRGFCAGVDRSIEIVEKALDQYGPPIYVRHAIVHNKRVVDSLKNKGVVFVEELEEIENKNARVIFSAHGVSPAVIEEASFKNLQVVDAVCPLVTKVHNEGLDFVGKGGRRHGTQVLFEDEEGDSEGSCTGGRIVRYRLILAGERECNTCDVDRDSSCRNASTSVIDRIRKGICTAKILIWRVGDEGTVVISIPIRRIGHRYYL